MIRYQIEDTKTKVSKQAEVLSFGVIAASSNALVVRVDGHNNQDFLEVKIVSVQSNPLNGSLDTEPIGYNDTSYSDKSTTVTVLTILKLCIC